MAIDSMERLKVSCAMPVVTAKSSLITGRAGNRICMDAGPSAEAPDNRAIIHRDNRVTVVCIGVSGCAGAILPVPDLES